MKGKRTSLPEWLGKRRTRARVHAAILLVLSGVLLGSFLCWDLGRKPPEAEDARQHFRSGQALAGGVFYLAYIGIVVRVLIAGRGRGSMTRTLLWIPTVLAAGLFGAVAVAALFSLGKEALDWGGTGRAQLSDIEFTFAGALSILPGAALIMAVTPLFIPLDILMQIPRLLLKDARTGIRALDDYARERRLQDGLNRTVEVLVVEDDIHCAAAELNFFVTWA